MAQKHCSHVSILMSNICVKKVKQVTKKTQNIYIIYSKVINICMYIYTCKEKFFFVDNFFQLSSMHLVLFTKCPCHVKWTHTRVPIKLNTRH